MSSPKEKSASSFPAPSSGSVPRVIEAGDRLRVLDHLAEGIAVCQADTFLYVNEPLLRMLGFVSFEALSAIHHVSEIAGAASFEAWLEALETGNGNQSWRRADGTRIQVDVSTSTMEVGGASVRVALVRDVTATWRAQAQLQQAERLAAVGTLAAGVAHQLNNPLAYVLANINFLSDELGPFLAEIAPLGLQAAQETRRNDLVSAMADAREGAERVARIVRDLRTFSRMEDERRELLDVQALLDSACVLVESELKNRSRLVKVYEQVSPVEANPSRVAQVFLNLLLNAIQAIPEGSPSRNEVVVRTYNDERDGTVVIEIRDTGVGMSPAVQARIFDPFFTLKPVGEGTGLGLTTCLAIVHSIGGRIAVESDDGQGATFRVKLPAATVSAQRKGVAPSVPAPAPTSRPRILVVDDELTLLSSLRRALARDMDVELANSGAEALALLARDQGFDVILCDIMMPDITGIDLFEEVGKLYPSVKDRFIFMTGGAFSPNVRQFLDTVEQPRLEKPFDIRELRRLIRKRVKSEAAEST